MLKHFAELAILLTLNYYFKSDSSASLQEMPKIFNENELV